MANQESAVYQWFNAETNLPITTETNQSFIPVSNGLYLVEVTLDGCTERSDVIEVDTLGLEQFSSEELQIYPNPSLDFITVDFNSQNELQLSIIDLSGKLQKQKNISGKTRLNIKTLPSGIYFLKLVSKEKTGTFKFVKK